MKPTQLFTYENALAYEAQGRPAFPHMSVADSAVWRAFLEVNPWTFDSVAYDVGVGGKAAGALEDTGDLKPMWESLLKKRIDAVPFIGDEVWAVEVKPLANMAALGQSLSYAYLWNHKPREKRNARPVVVCSRVDADVDVIYVHYGVSVIVVSGAKGEPPELVAVLGPLASTLK